MNYILSNLNREYTQKTKDYLHFVKEKITVLSDTYSLNNCEEDIKKYSIKTFETDFIPQYFKKISEVILFGEYIYLLDNTEIIFSFQSNITKMYLEIEQFTQDFSITEQISNSLKIREDNIENFTNNELAPFLQNIIDNYYTTSLVDPVKTSLNILIEFVSKVKHAYTSNFGYRTFVSESDYISNSTEYNNSIYKDYLVFFIINIKIADYDHFLNPDEQDFRSLYSFFLSLKNNYGSFEHRTILLDKCSFLISKCVMRIKHLYGKTLYLYSNNSIKMIESVDYNSEILNVKKKYIFSHYELEENWKNSILKEATNILNNYNSTEGNITVLDLEKMTCLELHRLIKYAKDYSKNYSLVNKIRNVFQNKYDESLNNNKTTSYDKHAYKLLLNYAYNNELSLFIELSAKEKFKEAEDLYNEICDIQKKTNIHNYFLQLKYLTFLIEWLENNIEKIKTKKDKDYQDYIIRKCEEYLTHYRKNILWSEMNLNYVLILPSEECFTDIQDKKIFTCSSFCLPLSNHKYIEEFKEYPNKLMRIKTDTTIKLFNLKNEDINNEIQKKEIRNIEILGIFSALISFVISSVPNFKYVDNSFEAFLFMFSLSSSLVLFFILITSLNEITSSRLINNKRLGYIVVFLILCLCSWIILFYLNDKIELFYIKSSTD